MIDFSYFGLSRNFSHTYGIFTRKRKISNILDISNKCKRHSIISESRIKELLQNRQFISVSDQKCNNDPLEFTICSYNILAQYQLENNIYLYTHCDANVLEWPMRWHNIKNDLIRMDCDVYCIQEVQCDHYHNDIEPVMRAIGYKGFLSAKTGKKLDGCAMFVKNNKFNCDLSTFETITFHHTGIQVLSTDNVGQIALLAPLHNPESKICVANTHLFFNPNRGEIKLAEISLFLSKIDTISNSGRNNDRNSESFYWPVIFCGDLNSEPTSIIYKFLSSGRLDFKNIVASDVSGQNKTSFFGAKNSCLLSTNDLPPRIGISNQLVILRSKDFIDNDRSCLGSGVLSHLLKLRSAYTYSTKDKPRLVTAFTNADTCAVDFIFYRHVEEKVTPYIELVSYLELLSSDEFFSFGGIPNNQHGSDHIPIVAKFHLHLEK